MSHDKRRRDESSSYSEVEKKVHYMTSTDFEKDSYFDPEDLRKYMEDGGSLQTWKMDFSILNRAVAQGDEDAVRIILECVKYPMLVHINSLCLEGILKRPSILKIFLEHGFSLNRPLSSCVIHEQWASFRLLCEKEEEKSFLTSEDKNGALVHAIEVYHSHPRAVARVLEIGGDPNAVWTQKGGNTLHVLMNAIPRGMNV